MQHRTIKPADLVPGHPLTIETSNHFVVRAVVEGREVQLGRADRIVLESIGRSDRMDVAYYYRGDLIYQMRTDVVTVNSAQMTILPCDSTSKLSVPRDQSAHAFSPRLSARAVFMLVFWIITATFLIVLALKYA